MNVSQHINSVSTQDRTYDDDITITDMPKGHFPAVTSNTIADGHDTREITVTIMQLEQSQGGTMTCNPGLFVRYAGETAIKVSVQDDTGNEVASNTTNYSN